MLCRHFRGPVAARMWHGAKFNESVSSQLRCQAADFHYIKGSKFGAGLSCGRRVFCCDHVASPGHLGVRGVQGLAKIQCVCVLP